MRSPLTFSEALPSAVRNPSREVTKELLTSSGDGGLRGLIDRETCDIFVWKATEYSHKQIANTLNRGLVDRMSLFRVNAPDQIDNIIVWPKN